jgi:hypothetical protein
MRVTSLDAKGGGGEDVTVLLSPDRRETLHVKSGVVLYGLSVIYRDCEVPKLGDTFTVTLSDHVP